jgi:DNA polymerase-3 subunit alpha
MYADDMDRTSKLIAELPYFNIKLQPIKFGKSGADYTMDKENNSIYKGIASVKFCNSQIADELLELSHNHYDTFIDLLKDIKEKTSLNTRQLAILTGLNFFDDWGKNQYLLNIIDIYDKFSSAKIIAKNKMESLGISDYLMAKYAGKETKSQYRELDNQGLIKELCNNVVNESMNIVDQIKFDMEYLEYTDYTNPQMADYYYIVIDFTTYSDATRPTLLLRNINNGEEIKTRIKQSKIFKAQPFGQFSILKIEGFSYEFKKRVVNGEWISTDETEPILEEYELIKG